MDILRQTAGMTVNTVIERYVPIRLHASEQVVGLE